jgi:hypothetical protein
MRNGANERGDGMFEEVAARTRRRIRDLKVLKVKATKSFRCVGGIGSAKFMRAKHRVANQNRRFE